MTKESDRVLEATESYRKLEEPFAEFARAFQGLLKEKGNLYGASVDKTDEGMTLGTFDGGSIKVLWKLAQKGSRFYGKIVSEQLLPESKTKPLWEDGIYFDKNGNCFEELASDQPLSRGKTCEEEVVKRCFVFIMSAYLDVVVEPVTIVELSGQ